MPQLKAEVLPYSVLPRYLADQLFTDWSEDEESLKKNHEWVMLHKNNNTKVHPMHTHLQV